MFLLFFQCDSRLSWLEFKWRVTGMPTPVSVISTSVRSMVLLSGAALYPVLVEVIDETG
jgi:hypothetical protein